MAEEPNVNRLNGIPNFGHGFPKPETPPTPPQEETLEDTGEQEEVEITNQ